MKQLSRFTQIGILVAALHVMAILAMVVSHATGKRPQQPKPIAVRTVLAPRPPAASPPPAKKAAPQAAAKKEAKAAPVSKKEPKVELGALQKIAGSLGAIATSTSQQPSKFAVSLPPTIEIQTEQRPGYGEMVAAILQESLDLPEFGEVVAKIEIAPNGTVASIDILETKSRKNAEFLKKRLQELAFPCFNEFGLSENRLHFTITFHNVENR